MDLIFPSLQFSTHSLVYFSLLSYKRFVTLLRCRYGPAYGNDRLQKHQKVVTKLCAMSSHVSHPLPEPPLPAPRPPAHHNRYQNTSLPPTATFTTVSTPTPTHMIYSSRGPAVSLTLQYLSRIHVLGVRSQSGGTARRTYFSHCAWIGQQELQEFIYKHLQSVTLY